MLQQVLYVEYNMPFFRNVSDIHEIPHAATSVIRVG